MSSDKTRVTQKILKPTAHEPTGRRFQSALHVAVGLLGWLIPDTGEVVKATRLEDEDFHGELPDELQDPLAILNRDRQNIAQASASYCDPSEATVGLSSLNLLIEEIANAK